MPPWRQRAQRRDEVDQGGSGKCARIEERDDEGEEEDGEEEEDEEEEEDAEEEEDEEEEEDGEEDPKSGRME